MAPVPGMQKRSALPENSSTSRTLSAVGCGVMKKCDSCSWGVATAGFSISEAWSLPVECKERSCGLRKASTHLSIEEVAIGPANASSVKKPRGRTYAICDENDVRYKIVWSENVPAKNIFPSAQFCQVW